MSTKALLAIEKAIDNTILQTVLKNAKKYLKPFKKKAWYDNAVKYLSEFEIVVAEILLAQQDEYIKLFEKSKKIYIKPNLIQKAVRRYRTDEYLDKLHNRVIVPDIVDKLNVLSSKFEGLLKDSYDKYITNGLIKDSAELVYKDVGAQFDFNKFDESTRDYLRDKSIKWSKQVNEATEKEVKKVLTEGFEKGLGSYELASKIQQNTGFSYRRSEAIARTEVLSASNYVDYVAYVQSDIIVGFEWYTNMDGRCRPTHASANGQKRAKGKPFDVGGYKLMYPMDSSLGAPAKEIIQCRCSLRPVYKGDGLDSDTVYDQKNAGTDEWLHDQSIAFQESYIGGKIKQSLFEVGAIGVGDKETPTDAVMKELFSTSIKNICNIKGINPSNVTADAYYENLIPLVLEVQAKGIKQKKEYARVVDYKTGKALETGSLKDLIAGSDKKNEVSFTKEQLDEINKNENSYIVLHNHPASISFSFGDIVLFFRNKGIKSLIVVGHDGSIYFLSGNGKIKNLPDDDILSDFIVQKDKEILQNTLTNYLKTYKNAKANVAINFKREYNIVIAKELKDIGLIYLFEEAF